MKKVTFMLFAFLSMTIGFAQTETLAEWTPVTVLATDSYGVSPFTASTTADNLVIGGLTRGSGIGTTSGTPAANAWGGTGFSATSAVEAVDENEFVTFTITADTGYTFSIESIEPYNIRRSAAGPTTGQWQYQVDSGTFTDIGSAITWGTTTSNSGNNQTAIDLSGISDLQDIEADTTVTFRLLLWGASGTGGTWYFNGHNNATNKTLTVLGTVEEESITPPPACDISVTISSSGWGDVVTWNLLDGDGTSVLSGGTYGSNYSDTQVYIALNPPYTLQIVHASNTTWCDNDVDYLVTIGGVTEISGTITDPCSGGTTNLPLTTDLTACIPSCPAPANLSADNLTFTSAELSWTGNGTLFDIEWGIEGFTQGDGTEVTGLFTNTYLLDGVLTAETSYDFYVREDCGTDGLSTWAGPYTFFTGYCGVSTDWTSDYISAFSTTGAIQNVSYSATSQPSGSYANETTQVIQQAQGLSVDFSSTFVGGGNAIKIWVDVNNDFVFDEVTEVVFYEASTAATKTGTVTVPVDLPVGEYRVRVRGQFGSTANPPACGNVPYGSTIDFTLQVTAAPSCLPPTVLSATTTSNSATLSWISTGTLFDVEYGALGFVQGTGTLENEVSNPYTVNGLAAGAYDFYVRQDCGAGDESIWAGPYSFIVGAYQGGDIPTQSGTSAGITVNSTDYCTPEPTLTIDVPAGMQIASLQVQYSMTAHNGAWMSEQRSFIYSPTLNTGEATMTSGTGTAGTLEYNRSMDFANGATGSVDFVLRAWRTWSTFGEEGCSVYNNYVNNGTWVIIPTFEPFVDPCADITTPVGDAIQTLDLGDTLADLDVTGTDLTWYSDVALTTEVAETLVFDQVGEFTYYVTQTVGDCTSDALAITVTVVDPCAGGMVVPVFSPVNSICQGGFLLALPTTSTNGITGTWSPALNNMETTTYEFTPDAGQCATTVTMTIEVNVVTPPTAESPQTLVAIIQTVEDIVVTDVTGTLTWYDADGNVVDDSTILEEGTYTFYVTQTIGDCESEATEVVVVVTSEVSTGTFDNASFRAYPNPVNDFLNVSYSKEITNVVVVNMLGQIIVEKAVNTTETQIDMTSLPTGSYFVKVTVDGAVKTIKVIKQ